MAKYYVREDVSMTLFRIIPDRSVSNNQNRKFWRLIHELLSLDHPLRSRLARDGMTFRYRFRDVIWFDVVMKAKNDTRKVEFYICVPEKFARTVKQKLTDKHPQITVEEVPLDNTCIPETAEITEYRYTKHDILSLRCDDREQESPISSIINAAYDMQDGDFVRLSVGMERVDRNKWKGIADYAWSQLDKKRVPSRVRFDGTRIMHSFEDLARLLAFEVKSIIDDTMQAIQNSFFKSDTPIAERKKPSFSNTEYKALMMNGDLSTETKKKRFETTFKTRIRLAVDSESRSRRHLIRYSISNALAELAGDNTIEPHPVRVNIRAKVIDELNSYQFRILDRDINVMSAKEIGKLHQLPTADLQRKYSDLLDTKQYFEADICKELRADKGIYIADANIRGETIPIRLPAGEKNWDELCLPHIVIGGMGQGKTEGFAANWLVEAVRNGFGGIAIDAAKKEIGKVVSAALPPDQVKIFNLARTAFSLDWCEVKHANHSKNMLKDVVMAFFDDEDGTGIQTKRYIEAAVFAMQTGRLSEIIKIFEDDEYRNEVVKKMTDTIHKQTLASFSEKSEARQMQILDPIYNRLNTILGDEWLLECMESNRSIDMVEIMSQKKAFIFDVPDSDGLTEQQINLIVNLLSSKIAMAMRLRPEEKQFPFFVLYDEPDQYLRSAAIWDSLATKSRKYRVGFIWMFHTWSQIPKKTQEIIRGAMPHFHIYPGDVTNFKSLEHYLDPLTVDDGLKLKKFHAINCIRINSEMKSFIAHMSPPPRKV